jgi:hypothetical protein
MNRRGVMAISLIGLIAIAFRIWWGPTYQYRYRIALEVETPQGSKTASSVVEITHTPGPKNFLGVNSNPVRFKGEAVFLDLGADKHVVMLIASEEIAFRAFELNSNRLNIRTPHQLVVQLPSGTKATLKLPDIPKIVTFTDMSDPTSFKIVYSTGYRSGPVDGRPPDAEVLVDNFESLFGAGYRLKSVTVELVDPGTPLTEGIEKKMAWWNKPKPWLESTGQGYAIDTRSSDEFRWGKEHFKEGF